MDRSEDARRLASPSSSSSERTAASAPSSSDASTRAEEHATDGVKALDKLLQAQEGNALNDNVKLVLTEAQAWDKLGFTYPTWKKWTILSVIFAVQCSMNFNASVYANAVAPLSRQFDISEQAARVGQMIFLVAYAFGSELWAPWSEELGRYPILQLSLFLVNIWQIPAALAPNFGTIVVARFLGGICSAGGSVTLGMVADMWKAEEQQFAVAFIVFSSVVGSVLGPVFGGLIEAHLSWHWNFWIQLIFGGVVQVIHFFLVPETSTRILLDREAKRRREAGEAEIYGPSEVEENRFSPRKIVIIWIRPFEMFVREPIVLFLSLLSGFSDSLIFTFLQGFDPVFKQWGFGTVAMGLAFISLLVGYIIAYASFMRRNPNSLLPEARLKWLLFTAPLEPIGLFGFAWTSLGPAHGPWIAPMIFAAMIAIANYAIYMATIDYMIQAYGPYAASATGGNGFARDLLAGIAAMYSAPLYANLGRDSNEWASTLLGFLGILVVIPVYIFYKEGPAIRARCKFAQEVALRERESRPGTPML
ncbi:sugar transporter [Neolentinus lepideus HHB14362 ss-1]|uniref:Sugar transporter n=1 Tax=Neolentinus lepideus HHB14362 ss-1 TaxID=1314782 RepID=A0A165UWF6_9AGAM|nr:sugar transporter [Neolentinus lepideus HHB14362 ss-1]